MIKKIKNSIRNLLIKTQKITGTDNIYIATHGSYLGIGNIIGTISSLLLAMAFARLLPKETYGNYRYILSIMAIVAITALSGMETAIIQATARGYEGTFKKILKTRFRWALMGSIATIIVGIYFLVKNNASLSISFFIAAIFFPIIQSASSYSSYLTGKKLFGIQVKYSTLLQIISALFLITTMFLTKNLIILVSVYFVSNALLNIFFLLRTLKKNPPNNNSDDASVVFGKHMTVMDIIVTIGSQLDKILLFNFLGASELAIYSFVDLPVRAINEFLSIIRALALPKLSARTREEIKKTLLKKVLKFFLILIPIIAAYILIAPLFYKIFFPEYMQSVFYSQIYVFTLIAFPFTVLALSFEAKMMKKELYKLNIISPVIKIIFMVVLLPIYGLLGLILAQVLSRIADIAIISMLFRKV